MTHTGARGLADDVAVLQTTGEQLVLTTDTMVEGVHYRLEDPPETVGWKLAAVNLSDLAAKGAMPRACLLNYMLSGNREWDERFLKGLDQALEQFSMPLVGGDTVAQVDGARRTLALTAIGAVPAGQPIVDRSSAKAGDILCVGGPVGDAGAGLALLVSGERAPEALISAYQRPMPQVALGQRVAPLAHAMMDVSDGLLLDASRMAEASGIGIEIDTVPLSDTLRALSGCSVEARLSAASAGDDYVLLAAIPASDSLPEGLTPIGRCSARSGLSLRLDGVPIPLPTRLGWMHG